MIKNHLMLQAASQRGLAPAFMGSKSKVVTCKSVVRIDLSLKAPAKPGIKGLTPFKHL